MDEQHVYHHNVTEGPRINVKVEKNSRGYNFEATVTGAASVDEALALIDDALAKLAERYDKPGL